MPFPCFSRLFLVRPSRLPVFYSLSPCLRLLVFHFWSTWVPLLNITVFGYVLPLRLAGHTSSAPWSHLLQDPRAYAFNTSRLTFLIYITLLKYSLLTTHVPLLSFSSWGKKWFNHAPNGCRDHWQRFEWLTRWNQVLAYSLRSGWNDDKGEGRRMKSRASRKKKRSKYDEIEVKEEIHMCWNRKKDENENGEVLEVQKKAGRVTWKHGGAGNRQPVGCLWLPALMS